MRIKQLNYMVTNSRFGKHTIKTASVILVVCLVIGIGMTKLSRNDGSSNAKAASQIEPMPTLQTRAHGFPITNIVGNRKEGYQVTMRNDYAKSVVAFQLGADKGRMTRDLIEQNKIIGPGASYTENYSYEPVLDTKPLTIFGVVFEDGSGAGQRDSVKAIKDMRLGAKIQLAQFMPILERTFKSLKADSSNAAKAVDTLLSKTNALSNVAVDGQPPYVKFGFPNEKQRILSEIQTLKSMQEGSGSLEQKTENQIMTHLLHFKAKNEERDVKLANPLIQ